MKTRFTAKIFNKVVLYLTLSDAILYTSLGLSEPFMSIYILEEIDGGSIANVGLATTIFMVSKGLTQIPVSAFLDKRKGEIDEFVFLILGTVLLGLSWILLAFSSTINQVFLIQAIYGIGFAFIVPSWFAIFSNHLDKGKSAMEWTFDSTVISIGTALSAALGGYLITSFGYQSVFVFVGVLSIVSSLFIFAIRDVLKVR